MTGNVTTVPLGDVTTPLPAQPAPVWVKRDPAPQPPPVDTKPMSMHDAAVRARTLR